MADRSHTNDYLGLMPEGLCLTYQGKTVAPMSPSLDDFDIVTIAHSLALKTRWNGQCISFYSVAQHCIHVADLVAPEFKLKALFHEMDEVFLPDIPRPLKPLIPKWKDLALDHQTIGFEAMGLSQGIPIEVHHADNIMLATEARDLMRIDARARWGFDVSPAKMVIIPLSPHDAECEFLLKYDELKHARAA